MMDATATTDLVRDNLRRFASRLEPPGAATDLGERLRDLDLLEMFLPEALGGLGADLRTLCSVIQTLSEERPALGASLLTHAFAQRLVLSCEESEGARRIAADAAGRVPRLGHPAYAEPGPIDGLALEDGHGKAPALRGHAALVVNAPHADAIVLHAGGEEDSLVLVSGDAPGLHPSRTVKTHGMAGCPAADLAFEGVPVMRLARGQDASAAVERTRSAFRPAVLAILAGVITRSLRAAHAYTHERHQGGRPIVQYPQVRAMLADMAADRALCAAGMEAMLVGALDAAAAEGVVLRAKEAAVRATSDGVQLLGGYGYMEDYGQAESMRDARQTACLLGRPDLARQWLADQLDEGKRGA